MAHMKRWSALLAGLLLFSLSGGGLAAEHVVYYHNDALGSPVAATNDSGEVLWSESYEPYGSRVVNPTDPNRLWYTGKPEESELGLTYFGARWYEPGIGRFHGMDPKDVEPGDVYSFNRYAYANNNPYRYVDPDGRATWPTNRNALRAGGATGYVGYFGLSRTTDNGLPKPHKGVDVLGNKGDPVYAFEGGTVVYAGDSGNEAGKMIQIEHARVGEGKAEKFWSVYMHLSTINAKAKDKVEEGSIIGAVGATGNAAGTPTHLHFQLQNSTGVLDPGGMFDTWDRVRQFFRGIAGGGPLSVPKTNYENAK